jgi:hypothetical protein
MSDDLRQREPARDRGDNPTEDGTRSDHAGTSAPGTTVGPAPPGRKPTEPLLPDRPDEPPTGQATGAGGGYGSGSDRGSSGGTGDAETPAGEDPQTDWLRKG